MQLLVALKGERWDNEMARHDSPLFLLTPTTLNVELGVCLVQTNPELEKFCVVGKLDSLSINVADYRLIKLVEILDSLIAPEMSPPLETRYHYSAYFLPGSQRHGQVVGKIFFTSFHSLDKLESITKTIPR